ncbi:MAG: thermonuclease family protein [Dongiaceae bacterium]
MMIRTLGCLPIATFPAGVAHAAGLDDLTSAGIVTVAAAIDTETLRLEDGRVVRLAGIDVPKQGQDYDPNYGPAATNLINQLTEGRRIEILRDVRKFDRHGRLLAHVRRVGGDGGPDDWLQGALLARGLARVMTLPGNTALAAEMLAIEGMARSAGRGLWSDAGYRVLTIDDLESAVGRFQVVEGTVVDVALTGRRGYLNFGSDYKTDFTVTFETSVRRLLDQAGIDPLAIKGHRIRVRGWLESFNGPMIEMTHPQQIEVLE